MKTLLSWLSDPFVHLLIVVVVVVQLAAVFQARDAAARAAIELCPACNHRHSIVDGCDDEVMVHQTASFTRTTQR